MTLTEARHILIRESPLEPHHSGELKNSHIYGAHLGNILKIEIHIPVKELQLK